MRASLPGPLETPKKLTGMFDHYDRFRRTLRARITGFSLAGKWVLPVCLGLTVSHLQAQPAPFPDPKYWTTDGPVNAILVTNDSIYLGGDFSYLGPRTGPVGLFDQATGRFLGAPARIAGTVSAVQPDGAGGWFIGGSFANIGTTAITNLAHLHPDLSVDTEWNAEIFGTSVNSLILDNGRLYVGGQFQKVHGVFVSGLIGLNAGDASSVWNPNLSGTVYAMKRATNLLYVGGNFYNVGNSNRQNLAAISTGADASASDWNPGTDQQVFTLDVSGNNVYAGGQFTTAGTKPRNHLAAIDATTGVAISWNPNPNGIVRAITVTGTSVYVAGDFTTIGGQNRHGFGAVNSGNGAAQGLDFQILAPNNPAGLVRSMLLQGSSLYLGGAFTNAMGAKHRLIVGVDVTSTQVLPTPMASDFNGQPGAVFGINAMASENGKILVAGDFYSFVGVDRQRAAALSRTTGAALPWAPSFSGPVSALAYGNDVVYVGGSYTNLNGTNTVTGLVAVDPVNGAPTYFTFLGTNQFADVTISALVSTTNALYVGGAFTGVADQKRRFLAAVNPDTGVPIPAFDAKLGGGYAGVSSLALAGSTLYAAGDFSTVNAQNMPRLAGFSTVDGTALNWTPNPNQTVTELAATADSLYVGGLFTQIGGIALRNFAGFSLLDNSLLGVDASASQSSYGVNAIAATPTTLYVAGSFDSIGGEFRQNLGCLASFNASSYDWNPCPDQPPTVITLTDDLALVGGPFRYLGQYPTNILNGFLAVFSRGGGIVNSARTANGTLQVTALTGDRTDAVVQSTTNLLHPNWVNEATNDTPGFSWSTELPVATSGNKFYRVISR
jgi:trimeric autotransporter adhesin